MAAEAEAEAQLNPKTMEKAKTMPDEGAREFLTGWALIALAIESSKEKANSDISRLMRTLREMSLHGSGPQLGGGGSYSVVEHGGGDDPYFCMARNAVKLADACIKALNAPPES